MVVMKGPIRVRQSRFILVCLLSAVAVCAAAAAQAQLVSVDEIEARVRQVYFEGYPVTDRDPLGPTAVERLGEMLRDPADEPYWANIVLALGASENSDAYRQLADFAANRPEGEASSPVYQARVSLPVALGNLAHRHPSALGLLEEMARDAGLEPGWSFQSLEGASLAGALRRSAITGLAVSGRPEAAAVLADLASRAAAESAESAELDELLQHLAFAQTLHSRAASQGPASVLGRRPVVK